MADTLEIKFDDSEVVAALDRVEKQLVEIGDAGAESGKEIAQAMDFASGFVEGFNEELKAATAQVVAQTKAADAAKKETGRWGAAVKDLAGNFVVAGQSLSQWSQQLRGFAQVIQQGTKATEGATIATRIFSTALKATGIGLIIAAIASLIGYFARMQSGLDKVSAVASAIGAVFDKLIGSFQSFGSAIVKVFQGDFKGALSDAADGIKGITVGLVDAAVEAYNLERAFQALRDATIRTGVENARQRAELERLRAVVDDDTRSIAKRIQAQREAAQIEREIAERNFQNAEQDLRLKQRQLDASEDNADFIKQEADAQKAYFEAQSARDAAILSGEREARELRKTAAEEAQKAHEKRLKALDEESKALQKIARDLEDLRIAAAPDDETADILAVEKRFDALQRTAAAGIEKLNEIEARRGLSPEELAQREELARIQVSLEERRLSALVDVLTEYAEREIAIEKEQQDRKDALAQKDYDRALKALETERALRGQQIDITAAQVEGYINLLRERGASEEQIAAAQAQFDLEAKRARLESELQFQEALLALTDAGDAKQVERIQNQIQLIKTQIGNLVSPAQKSPGDKPFSIWSLVGVDDKQQQQALQQAADQIIGILNDLAEARVREAEAAVQAADEKVAAAEDALAKEQELKDQGLANDTERRQKELEEAKKQRQEALKEQAKAQRAQILLDTATQLSSLITASANVFKSLSSLPFGAGIPIAIGLIALMFGAFVKAKVDALNAVPKYRVGGRIRGRSHEEGGEFITDAQGHIIGEAEGGEWILPKRQSEEHDVFLQRMQRGEFDGVNLNHLGGVAPTQNSPAAAAAPRLRQLEERRQELSEHQHFAALVRAYGEGAAQIVEAIKGKPNIYPWKDGYIQESKQGSTIERKTVLPE